MIDLRPLVSASLPLERAVEAFERASDCSRSMKVQLEPWAVVLDQAKRRGLAVSLTAALVCCHRHAMAIAERGRAVIRVKTTAPMFGQSG